MNPIAWSSLHSASGLQDKPNIRKQGEYYPGITLLSDCFRFMLERI